MYLAHINDLIPKMLKTLSHYISQHTALTPEEVKVLDESIPVKEYPKGTVLLSEGEISRECYYILSGCIRQYSLIDGEEKTTAFYTEGQAVVSFTSFSEQKPATHFLTCAEHTRATVGNFDSEDEFLKQHPRFEAVTRSMMEQSFGKTQEEFALFIASSPEERYLNLLNNRPDLLQRVPQHQLASYLGVTPESLSRIRKRITLKG